MLMTLQKLIEEETFFRKKDVSLDSNESKNFWEFLLYFQFDRPNFWTNQFQIIILSANHSKVAFGEQKFGCYIKVSKMLGSKLAEPMPMTEQNVEYFKKIEFLGNPRIGPALWTTLILRMDRRPLQQKLLVLFF